MAKVLNLNRARKKKAREDEKTTAERNRAAHGRTKAEKQAARRDREQLDRQLDGARREVHQDEDSEASVDDE